MEEETKEAVKIEQAMKEAAKETGYDEENPLTPVSARGENAVEYMEKEKAYYRELIERLKKYI